MISCCGYCPHNGNEVLTTYPPKVRCELTGKLHFTNDSCDVDVAAVVRCKDCKYYNEYPNGFGGCEIHKGSIAIQTPLTFCAWGEKREDD